VWKKPDMVVSGSKLKPDIAAEHSFFLKKIPEIPIFFVDASRGCLNRDEIQKAIRKHISAHDIPERLLYWFNGLEDQFAVVESDFQSRLSALPSGHAEASTLFNDLKRFLEKYKQTPFYTDSTIRDRRFSSIHMFLSKDSVDIFLKLHYDKFISIFEKENIPSDLNLYLYVDKSYAQDEWKMELEKKRWKVQLCDLDKIVLFNP
jgi:hypothetical protein